MNSPVEVMKSKKRNVLEKYVNDFRKEKLFTSNVDAILILDLSGLSVEMNSSFERLTGYTNEELKKITFQSLIQMEDLDNYLNYFCKSVLGQYHHFDCKIKNKFGEITDLNVMNIPIVVEGQIVGIQMIAKDITHLKKKEKEIRKIENIHSVMSENVMDIMLTTNIMGNILYISPSCQTILGYQSDELMGKHLSILIHKDDKEKAFCDREKLITNLECNRGTYRFLRKDGSYAWVESICKPVMDRDTQNISEVVSVIRDITEHVKAEEELCTRRKAYRDIVEKSPDAIVMAKNDKILFINEMGINLLKANHAKDLIQKSILDFIPSDYHTKAKERMMLISKGETTNFSEYEIIRMDGSTFTAEIKSIPTFFQNEPAIHVIIRDITERKKTQELLLNSEKLTIAGQLAAGIAHEVRNPLTAIKGFLQLMEAQLNNKTYFSIIQSEMDRIELILSELLILAKPQDLKFERENLSSLIEEVKTLIDTQAIMNNVQIYILNEYQDLVVKCDRNQLKQVFINFLKNAIEAMPEGGIVTIEIKKLGTNKLKIFFKDTGIGIPQSILKRIGEPFFTTKENGTGLGIMISKQIIENHNGTVHFWSDKKGTMIEVILPIDNKQ